MRTYLRSPSRTAAHASPARQLPCQVVTVSGQMSQELAQIIGFAAHPTVHSIENIDHAFDSDDEIVLFDLDLALGAAVAAVREALATHRDRPKRLIFIVDPNRRAPRFQAGVLGASTVLPRPLQLSQLRDALQPRPAGMHEDIKLTPQQERYFGTSSAAMELVNKLAQGMGDASPGALKHEARELMASFDALGLEGWLHTMRAHHDATFQHCLIVTGTATAFARHLGFHDSDVERLTLGALLHDVGKARIPLSILEKPGPLNAMEEKIMRTHPRLGADILTSAGDFDQELMDIVLHHHELLDGAGYPDGLSGDEISDVVRLTTICDVFGALMERRSYKPPMARDQAFAVLVDMGPKLDQLLVKAFKPIALETH
jgi:putative nucleotidyltransferase with HDIG domain